MSIGTQNRTKHESEHLWKHWVEQNKTVFFNRKNVVKVSNLMYLNLIKVLVSSLFKLFFTVYLGRTSTSQLDQTANF